MKYLIVITITAITVLTSCMDESIWADNLPNRHDIIRKNLEESLSLVVYTSIDFNRSENKNLQKHWKEI